ncbi:MAG: aggregation factor core, partial [Arenibacterium sp.]
EQVIARPDLRDGDKVLRLALSELSQPLSFTTDLDDTLGANETIISGAEISGASVALSIDGDVFGAIFDDSAMARISIPACIS